MKIFAFAGSNSSKSINKKLVESVLTYFEGNEIDELDLRDYNLPIYSADDDLSKPKDAYDFIERIKNTDVIICSISEHNRSITAVFKNLLDWVSRIDVRFFNEKKMLLMTTSPGAFGGGNSMNYAKVAFPGFKANIVETFSLPKFNENFDIESNTIVNAELLAELEEKIRLFKLQIEQ